MSKDTTLTFAQTETASSSYKWSLKLPMPSLKPTDEVEAQIEESQEEEVEDNTPYASEFTFVNIDNTKAPTSSPRHGYS